MSRGPNVDWFDVHTEWLNSNLRTIVDALRFQILHDGHGVPVSDDLRAALDNLNKAAEHFTNTFYREERK